MIDSFGKGRICGTRSTCSIHNTGRIDQIRRIRNRGYEIIQLSAMCIDVVIETIDIVVKRFHKFTRPYDMVL